MSNNTNLQSKIEPSGISDRIIRIQNGNEDINAFISEYIPFIKSSIYKSTGKHITKESDEMSVGLLAFNEAVQSYDPEKGVFLTFASWVIKRRIIDYLRKQNRINETSFSDLTESQISEVNSFLASDNYWSENPLKLEIEALTMALKDYDIRFEELALVSPKAKKTKEMCSMAVEYITQNPAIILKLKQKKRLPLKIFEENLQIPRKFMNRHRKYIIAVVEILTGDYLYLKEYIPFMGKEGQQ